MELVRLFLSLSPLLVILGLMAGLRWGLIRTGVTAWIWTLLASILFFGAGIRVVAVSQEKALFLAADVLAVVWGALLFYSVCDRAGGIQAIGAGLTGAIPWRGLRALALAWAFASFLQGAGGFGVPVVIIAPLMLAAGFSPIQSVLLPFLGHGWAVTFGSLGTSFQALMTATGLEAGILAGPSAILLGVLCVITGILVGMLAVDRGERLRLLPSILAVGFTMGITQYLLAVGGLWQVASLGAGLAGLVVIFGLGGILRGKKSTPGGSIDRNFLHGLSAYVLLIVVVLSAHWIAPLRDGLGSVQWSYSLPGVVTSIGYATPAESGTEFSPLAHPGMLLAYAALVVFLWFCGWGRYEPQAAGKILRATAQRAIPVSFGILIMVGVSTLLAYSGMTARLAEGLSASVGAVFPAVAPWLGAAGAFLTGSNTNSNLLFAPLQQRMADSLGVPERILLAAQTAGGAVGSVLSPAKVGLGSIAFRADLKEGDVMRRLLLPIGLLLAAASLCTVLFLL
jgi:lactate permease